MAYDGLNQGYQDWSRGGEAHPGGWDDWQEYGPGGDDERQAPSDDLDGLTQNQRAAVTTPDKPLLVLAGAGTGKTRILTRRIVHRLRAGDILPGHILALTFTKKAAGEMTRRLGEMIGPTAKGMDIGTFHSIAAKALRICDSAGGRRAVPADFTLLDETDQKDLLKAAAASISPAYAEEFAQSCKTRDVLADFSRFFSSLYPGEQEFTNPNKIPSFETLLAAYQTLKKQHNVLDFDDVLILFDRLLDEPRIRMMFQQRWRMVLVDEYQDTDNVQESVIRKICSRHRNLTCVGDDDQSIFSWRNARVSNILEFRSRWVEADIVRLEDNFRSTGRIIHCANNLIARNRRRHGKTLSATRHDGEAVRRHAHQTAFDEARHVSKGVVDDVRAGVPFAEIAVVCRVAAGLQEVQRQLLTDGIRYVMHAGSNVADKIETKLVAAWIRMATNPKDQTAFCYAYADKPRSVGKTTMARIREDARVTDTTIETILRQEYRDRSSAKHAKLHDFLDGVAEIRSLVRLGETPMAIVEEIIERSGIKDTIAKEREKSATAGNRDDRDRLEATANARDANLALMIEHAGQVETLADLAANVVLANEVVREENDSIWLGTIHASKSLEFRSVYLVGFEDGIIPSPRHCQDRSSADFEEERNLAYVGLTRAKDRLCLSWAQQRTMYGTVQTGGESEFVSEMGLTIASS